MNFSMKGGQLLNTIRNRNLKKAFTEFGKNFKRGVLFTYLF